MPIIKSAIKRARQTLVRRDRNVATKKDIKSALKSFTAKPSAESLSNVQSAIDTAVKKNVLNSRTAARRKAALSRSAKAAGVTLAGATKKSTKPVEKKASVKKASAKIAKPAASSDSKKTTTKKLAKKTTTTK